MRSEVDFQLWSSAPKSSGVKSCAHCHVKSNSAPWGLYNKNGVPIGKYCWQDYAVWVFWFKDISIEDSWPIMYPTIKPLAHGHIILANKKPARRRGGSYVSSNRNITQNIQTETRRQTDRPESRKPLNP